jgi:transposase
MYIGIDLHKKNSYITVMNKDGDILNQTRLPNKKEYVKEFFSSIERQSSVAMEATGNWYWYIDYLQQNGFDTKLGNSRKLKIIAETTCKTDKIDSKILADLSRLNFLPTCYIPTKQVRDLREILRYRIFLVRMRTMIKNRIHSILSKLWIDHGFSDLFGKAGRQFLSSLKLEGNYGKELRGCLKILDLIDKHISNVESYLRVEAIRKNPEVKIICTVPGISYISAFTLVSEIGDIERFQSAKKFLSYAGLVCSIYQSDEKTYYGHLKKQSNRYIKWILIEAAKVAIRSDSNLALLYQRVLFKKGRQKATIAVARKLGVIIYHMLKKKQEYKPNYGKRVYRVNNKNCKTVSKEGKPLHSHGDS